MSITLSRIVPLNLGLFQTPGNIWVFLETYFVVTTGEGVTGICQVKVREAGKHSTVHRPEYYLVLNISSVRVEKPHGGFHLRLYIGAPGSF